MSAYYCLGTNNATRGPFGLADVWRLIERGVVQKDTPVNHGSDQWAPLDTYPELACHLPALGIARRRTPGDMVACVILTLLFPVVGLFIGIIDVAKPAPRRWQGGVLLGTAVFAIVVASLLVGWMRYGGTNPAASALLGRGPQWEYKIAAPSDEHFDAEMSTWGHDGWELVSARRASSGSEHIMSYEVILKRPR